MTKTKKEEKMVQTTRFGLLYDKTPQLSYDELKSELRTIQRNIRQFKNNAATQFFDYMSKREAMKAEMGTGKYPPDEDVLDGLKISNLFYKMATETIPEIQTGNASAAVASVLSRFNTDYKDVLKGTKSLASFKRDQPINISGDAIKLYADGGKLYIIISIFSTAKRQALGFKNGQIKFEIWHKSKAGCDIVRKCLSGEYSHGSAMLIYNKNKGMWDCNLTYKFDAKDNSLIPDRICGIDIGFLFPVYAAVGGSHERLYIPGNEIDKHRRTVEALRRGFSQSRKFAGEGSVGHGYKKRMEPVNDIKDKIAKFRNNKNHVYSKRFVEFAVKNRCGIIQIRDLSGITEKTKEAFLKNWSYDDLKRDIKYKAKAQGIIVDDKIKPYYTSQRCFKCGYISEDNMNKRDFVCQSCGHKEHVDYNAAQNVATKDIDLIIERECEIQGIPYPPEKKKKKERGVAGTDAETEEDVDEDIEEEFVDEDFGEAS